MNPEAKRPFDIGKVKPCRRSVMPDVVMAIFVALTLIFAVPKGVVPSAVAQSVPVISAVRIGENRAIKRFVLTVSEPIRYRVFTLANPYRVVLDMPRVDWRLPAETKLTDDGAISAFRFGTFTQDTTRVVLDLTRPVKVQKSFALKPTKKIKAWRLVIDLEPISKDQFDRLNRALRAKARRQVTRASKVPPLVKPRRRRGQKPLVVIDPGHGGVDTGAISRHKVREKDVVLRYALTLRKALLKTRRYRVKLTRDKDVYIKLRQRYEIARRAGADLFISIHADSNPNPLVRGLSVYTLSEKSSDKEAAALARRENRSDIIAGVNLKKESNQVASILIDLAQRETMNMSARFAEILVRDMRRATRLLPRTHRYAGFAVLKAPDVPSVLVELGYLTNIRDERALTNGRHQRRLAKAMTRAISRYFTRLDKLSGRRSRKR